MLHKILGFSTAIILASCLIEGNKYPSFAANLVDHKRAESPQSHLIAQAKNYRVRLGDTLGGIANRVGMSLNQILSYNPQLRSRPNLIYVGEVINLGGTSTPPTASTSSSGRKYTVRSGDTLGGIAIRHGLSLGKILAYNPHLASRPNSIEIGETINVGSSQVIQRTNNTSNNNSTSTTTPPPSTQPTRAVAFAGLPTTRRQGSNNIGAKRGPDEACTKDGANMKAIAPENGLGFTFDDYPYFFWYFPGVESDSIPIVFTLIGETTREVNGKTKTRIGKVYEKELNLDRSGIIAFPLPAESEPLQEGKEYRWRIEIRCSAKTAMFLSYSIQRQSTDNPELISKLEAAPVDQHPLIFAESGVWFDALKMISLQLQQAPDDPILEKNWQAVLEEIEFNDLIGEPIQYIEPNN